jgi:hypothetical protein
MQTKFISYTSNRPPGLLRKAGAVVATAALAGLALMFSAVLLALLMIIGVAAWAGLLWKTRELRKQMRNFPPPGAQAESGAFRGEAHSGEVIEGEAVRVHEPDAGVKR